MSIISLDESNIHSALYQEDRRTWCLRKLTTGESMILFQTSHVNSASSGATGSCWAFCTSVWDGADCLMITGAHPLVQSFLPTPAPTILVFSLVPAVALCAHPLGLSMLSCLTQRLFCPCIVFSLCNVLSNIHSQRLPEHEVTGRDTLIVVTGINVIIKDNDLLISPFLRFYCCRTSADVEL